MSSQPIISLKGLHKSFDVSGGMFGPRETLRAVDGVDLAVNEGETLGVVGESGSGKSTLARLMMGLYKPTSGSVTVMTQDIAGLSPAGLRRLRRNLQIVFQDPYASLNPRMKVRDIIAEPLRTHEPGLSSEQLSERVDRLLDAVGLPRAASLRYPHEFSGGQRQRIGIARAIALDPKVLLLDEPVSALDVSIQAQVVNLLRKLQREFGLTYVFVAHDLSVVRQVADRVAVMYLGRVVELGTREQIFSAPLHPYTHSLLSAVPYPDPARQASRQRIILTGEIPSPTRPPSGCSFHTRCPIAQPRCAAERPPLAAPGSAQAVACFFPTSDSAALVKPASPVTHANAVT
jgi:oligopeptide/dipeptide ABC transporter ATP-binding protein